jgi:hypothetical protein
MIGKLLAMVSAAVTLIATPAFAADPGQKLDDATLAQSRGGFVMVDGITLDFAAELRTFIDGELALSTKFSLDPTSIGQKISPIDLALLTAGGIRLDPGSGQLAITPDGATAILHSVGKGQISNVLINSASDKTFRQELNLTLTLPGFEITQRGLDASRMGSDLAGQVAQFTGAIH